MISLTDFVFETATKRAPCRSISCVISLINAIVFFILLQGEQMRRLDKGKNWHYEQKHLFTKSNIDKGFYRNYRDGIKSR